MLLIQGLSLPSPLLATQTRSFKSADLARPQSESLQSVGLAKSQSGSFQS